MQLTSCCFQCQTEKPSSELAIPAARRKYLPFCVIGLGKIELGDRLLVYPRERKNPAVQGGDISDLAATSQGSFLLLNVRFQDVDWGSTTRRSEVRWRPEDAFPVASIGL
jgi:hypothetical protein